uniref:Uncharacterized protein n=1 Tax=Anguilla anguilla TaxID=7936 RepID=A0A0E9QHC1_ANGAN
MAGFYTMCEVYTLHHSYVFQISLMH